MDFDLLLPEISIAVTALLVILLDLIVRQRSVSVVVSLAGLAVAFGFSIAMWNGDSQSIFNGLLALDNYAIFFKLLFIIIASLVIMASVDYSFRFSRFQAEYHALLLVATLGMMFMAAATNLISVFVSFELVAIASYILVALLKNKKSTEASLKFVLLGGIASAVLLYGMALVFGFSGETGLAEIFATISGMSAQSLMDSPALLLGIVLMLAAFGFKIAAVPFQMWAPDVYEGAPTPVTLFLSVGSKAAGFAVILRAFFSAFNLPEVLSSDWGIIFAILSAAGILLGNILAIQQGNMKRMLAYSSIAHSGYIMIGLAAIGLSSTASLELQSNLLFYIVAFTLADLAAFTAVIIISNRLHSDLIEDYAGIVHRSRLLAAALTLSLISLIGLPPTVGFIAKFYIFSGAMDSGLLWLVIIAVIASVISAFYYLRVVKVMWLHKPVSDESLAASLPPRLALALSCLGILVLGIAPSLIIEITEAAASMLDS